MNSEIIKQKSAWPYAIISTFILLAAFDAYIVTRAVQTSTGTVTASPYEEGLQYEKKINAKSAAFEAGIRMSVSQQNESIFFDFSNIKHEPAVLKLRMMKPDNAALDRIVELKSKTGSFEITNSELQPGLWFIEATLGYEGENSPSYFFEARELIK